MRHELTELMTRWMLVRIRARRDGDDVAERIATEEIGVLETALMRK